MLGSSSPVLRALVDRANLAQGAHPGGLRAVSRRVEADRAAGTLIGAAAGLAVIGGVQAGLPLQPLFWAALIPLALLTAAWPSLRVSCITLVILSLIPADGPPLTRALDRVLEILLGVVASIAVLAALPDKSRRAR
jgi:uncharacterized membrane protein YccC